MKKTNDNIIKIAEDMRSSMSRNAAQLKTIIDDESRDYSKIGLSESQLKTLKSLHRFASSGKARDLHTETCEQFFIKD